MRRRFAATVAALALVLAGCSAAASPPPAPTPTSSAAPSPTASAAQTHTAIPTPTASVRPISTPTLAPTPTPAQAPTSAPTRPPAPTPTPTAPAPSPVPELTEAEMELYYHIREDALAGCVPRRTGLPPGAQAGIECSPLRESLGEGWDEVEFGLAARVGVYRFANDGEAAIAYLDRMVQAGVPLREGNCWTGEPGDASWIPGDGETWGEDDEVITYRGAPYNTARSGCFLDQNGVANVRLTCGGGIYMGVLGRDRDLGRLSRWASAFPPYAERDTPSPPGLCMGTDALVFPDVEY